MKLTHIDENGNARMVDVSGKMHTVREATAVGCVFMKDSTLAMIVDGSMPKGDVLSTARVAGIMAAKRTDDIIPMCHNVPLDSIKVNVECNNDKKSVDISATVRCTWKTGVEMEALTAVSVAALTIYDMCKAVDREMTISNITLIKKTGGKSDYTKGAY